MGACMRGILIAVAWEAFDSSCLFVHVCVVVLSSHSYGLSDISGCAADAAHVDLGEVDYEFGRNFGANLMSLGASTNPGSTLDA